MNSEKGVGRPVGILLILQMTSGLIVPFVLMDALVKGYPAFMDTAAASGIRICAGVGVAFLGLGLTLALGVWLYPFLSQCSKRTALWFLAVCTVSAAVDAVHNGTVLTMLAASEKFAAGGGADAALYQGWGAAAASLRRSAHIVQLFAIGAWIGTFYFSLFRFRLVPRPLAIFGLIGILGQFTGVTVMMFLGNAPIGYLAMPLAVFQAATAIWIMSKGLSLPGVDSERS